MPSRSRAADALGEREAQSGWVGSAPRLAHHPTPETVFLTPIIDPRMGDIEDDASSTKGRSFLVMAGSLLAEISLPKLFLAWLFLIIIPGLLLGVAPLIVSGWFAALSRKVAAPLDGIWPLLLLAAVLAIGCFGWRPLYRLAERGFWSLNSIAVQPGYALCRETLRHLMEHVLSPDLAKGHSHLRAVAAAGAGLILCLASLGIVALAWPASRWVGVVADLALPHRLVIPVLANAVVIVGAYLATASLAWGLADATMDQPRDLPAFDPAPADGRTWRVAHLSDLHVVGERYGFRIESGRSGPRGNGRLTRLFARLDEIHRERPLDFVLVTGDVTDAGRSAEWAVFLEALSKHAGIAARTFILPGNHDVNVVDRANPARLELPTSPGRRLRQMRALSAIVAVQGARVRVVDEESGSLQATLSCNLKPHRPQISGFADTGRLRQSTGLADIWADAFPMVIKPDTETGLGILLVNSTAETHFSFTNALGFISSTQARRIITVLEQFPRASWILALHHHLVEYPKMATALSERIGTALINGSWLVRQLRPMSRRIVVMHGHRHIDWMGDCGSLRIVSAPSPVMEFTNDEASCFYIHRVAISGDCRLGLLEPERIEIPGEDDVRV